MKQIVYAMVLLLAFGMVSAVNSVIIPEVSTLGQNDIKVVEYCVEEVGVPIVGLVISIEEWCQDQNGIVGCQPADDINDASLGVVALDAVTGADGCGDVQLTTTNAEGKYYFSVSGSQSDVQITRETGTINVVPEFTSIAAAVALSGAALLIWRKRK